jgi:hypothetical protein
MSIFLSRSPIGGQRPLQNDNKLKIFLPNSPNLNRGYVYQPTLNLSPFQPEIHFTVQFLLFTYNLAFSFFFLDLTGQSNYWASDCKNKPESERYTNWHNEPNDWIGTYNNPTSYDNGPGWYYASTTAAKTGFCPEESMTTSRMLFTSWSSSMGRHGSYDPDNREKLENSATLRWPVSYF